MRASNSLRRKFAAVWALLDERTRRLTAASEARTLGYGGIVLYLASPIADFVNGANWRVDGGMSRSIS